MSLPFALSSDSTWIAIAGIAGTLTAGIASAIATGRQARSRWHEERDAAQIDELRGVLDKAVAVLQRASLYEQQAILAANPTTASRLTLSEALAALDISVEEAAAIRAQLDLRAVEDHLASSFSGALSALEAMINSYTGARAGCDWKSMDGSKLDLERKIFEAWVRSFVLRGRVFVGPRFELFMPSLGTLRHKLRLRMSRIMWRRRLRALISVGSSSGCQTAMSLVRDRRASERHSLG